MLAEVGKFGYREAQSGHRLETSIALVCLLGVTCFVPVLLYCLPAQASRKSRKQATLPGSDLDWQRVLAVCFLPRVSMHLVMVLLDFESYSSLPGPSNWEMVPFAVEGSRRWSCSLAEAFLLHESSQCVLVEEPLLQRAVLLCSTGKLVLN
jgi:hypothetical protein